MRKANFQEFVELTEKNDVSRGKVIKPREQKMWSAVIVSDSQSCTQLGFVHSSLNCKHQKK